VFLQHGFYNAFKSFEHKSDSIDLIIQNVFLSGGTGVQIFFVLSGFLITYLFLKEIEYNGRVDLARFYMRRTLRIWPLYFATVLFGFLVYPFLKGLLGIHSDLCSRPWYYFTFLANFDLIHIAQNCPGKDAMTQSIVWSVSIEEQFYIVWPLLFFIFSRKYFWTIFVLVISGSAIFRFQNMGASIDVNYFHTLGVMGDLAIGGLGAYLVHSNFRFRSYWEQMSVLQTAGLYIGITLLFFFKSNLVHLPDLVIYGRYIFDVCWLIVILTQCFSQQWPWGLGKWALASKLGKISYGLYMLHPIGILIVDNALRLLHFSAETFGVLLLRGISGFALSVLISMVSYNLLELPFLKLKDAFAVRMR
jgi:peptidoglycan/LPS O-acetylase OafA/YrhL